MTDIDYDELDRAINTESISDVADDRPKTAKKLEITSSPATRRTGRFMDIVHPSSDMSGDVSRVNHAPERMLVAPLIEGEIPAETEKVFTPNAPAKPSEKILESIDEEEVARDDSPFIEGASEKVQKRPLGAHAIASSTAQEIENIAAKSDNDVLSEENVDELFTPEPEAVSVDTPEMEAEPAEPPVDTDAKKLPPSEQYAEPEKPIESPTEKSEEIVKRPSTAEQIPTPANVDAVVESLSDEESDSPYLAAASMGETAPKSHAIWWVILAILLVVIGVGVGAYIYITNLA